MGVAMHLKKQADPSSRSLLLRVWSEDQQVSISGELVGNADPQAHPRPSESAF